MDAFPVNKNARLHSKQISTDMSELKKTTQKIYEKANFELKKSFPGIEFNQAQTEVPELHLQEKLSWMEKQKETRKLVNHFKQSAEKHLQETAVVRTFGTDISFAKRNRIRMLESFETKECRKRTNSDIENVATGKKSKKDHVGTNKSWDEETCVNLVESCPDGYKINFSELARVCTVKNKENELPENGGQIVKEMLKNKNIDLSRFSYNRSIDEVYYRRKKRCLNAM